MNSSLNLSSDLNLNFTTCAPQVAELMLDLRDRKCVQHYGENEWSNADKQTKACFNFLCGNHTRNLPVVRFNKVRLGCNTHTSHPDLTPIP